MSSLTCVKNVVPNSASEASENPVQTSTFHPQIVHSRACGKVPTLAESLQKITDQRVEISIALPQILDLTDRVNHGRVMLAAKAPADLGQRRVRERLAEVHGDLPRHRH